MVPGAIKGTSYKILRKVTTREENMGLKNLLERVKKFWKGDKNSIPANADNDLVICEDERLKRLISRWTKCIGWKVDDFANILILIGVETPIRLTEFHPKLMSFKGTTASGTELYISLDFFEAMGPDNRITIREGERTIRYTVPCNNHSKKRSNMPNIRLDREVIQKDGKEITNYFSSGERSIVKLDSKYTLEIVIYQYDHSIPNLSYWPKKVEWYLQDLDSSYTVQKVYKDLLNLLRLTEEEVKQINNFSITLIETVDGKEKVRSKILLQEGIMQEYAILENEETFHLWKNGDWKFFSDDGIRIFYNSTEDQYTFSVTGMQKSIMTVEPTKVLTRVEMKISSLWKFFT